MKITTAKLDDDIPMLTRQDQYYDGYPLWLGIDTEMQFRVDGKYLWPHQEGYSQERQARSPFDWHGDGYAFELCTDPFTCLEYGSRNIGQALLNFYNKVVAAKTPVKAQDVEIIAPAVFRVPTSIQESASDDVKRLGCAPSLNVYGDAGNPSKLGKTVRTTGCHLHVSHQALNTEKTAQALVKWADVIVGNVWNFVSPERPKFEALRREAYGRAGEHRVRKYPSISNLNIHTYDSVGVEYRVLPGTVIHNPVYLTLCFNLYRTALRFAARYGNPSEEITDISREAINKADKQLSQQVIEWLPFGPPSKQLLHIIKDKPLTKLTPKEWYENSLNHNTKGHRNMAFNLGLAGVENG